MPKNYTGLGISLLYPDTWTVDDETESASVHLESPQGAFMAIKLLDSTSDLEKAVQQAGQAMKAEYDDLEQENLSKQLAGFQMNGITQRFVYLDLIVTSHIMSYGYNGIGYLIQIQGEDREMERLQIVFDAILTSMCKSLAGSMS